MLTRYQANGIFTVLVTGEMEAVPAFVYKDGQKTNEQRTWKNQALYRLKGVLPLVHGEAIPDGYIYVTDSPSSVAEIVSQVSVGQLLELTGTIQLRAAKGFGLTGSIFGSLSSENIEFSLDNMEG